MCEEGAEMRAKLKLRFPIGFMRLAYVSYVGLVAAFYGVAVLLLAVGFPWRPWDPSIQYPSLITLRLTVIGFALSAAITLSNIAAGGMILLLTAMIALCTFTTSLFLIETSEPLRVLQLAFATVSGTLYARTSNMTGVWLVALSILFAVFGAMWRAALPFLAIVIASKRLVPQQQMKIVKTMRNRQTYLP